MAEETEVPMVEATVVATGRQQKVHAHEASIGVGKETQMGAAMDIAMMAGTVAPMADERVVSRVEKMDMAMVADTAAPTSEETVVSMEEATATEPTEAKANSTSAGTETMRLAATG